MIDHIDITVADMAAGGREQGHAGAPAALPSGLVRSLRP